MTALQINGLASGRWRYLNRRRSSIMPADSNPTKEDAMWEIIRAGGGFMWPIILCSIAAVAIILERLWTLQSSRVIPRDLSQKVWNWIEADQLSDKLVAALEQNSPLVKLLAIGLANGNKPRAMMVERLEDGGRHVVHELERFLNTLGTITAVARGVRHVGGGVAADHAVIALHVIVTIATPTI